MPTYQRNLRPLARDFPTLHQGLIAFVSNIVVLYNHMERKPGHWREHPNTSAQQSTIPSLCFSSSPCGSNTWEGSEECNIAGGAKRKKIQQYTTEKRVPSNQSLEPKWLRKWLKHVGRLRRVQYS